jgi:ParB family transcriptional regulator, chromosome partitioning protein
VKAVEKLRETLGANIGESMGAARREAGGASVVLPQPSPASRYQGTTRIKGALEIPLDRVAPDPDQPRKEFEPEALERLAASLRDRGQIQPIRVRWDDPTQKWVIIAGERRWRAAALAGLATIAAVEAQGAPTPDEVLEDQLVENCLRDDLRPIEQARAFEALMNRRGWTQGELAERLHLAQPTISRALSLLTLSPAIQVEVDSGRVPPTIGHELTKVEDPATRDELAARAIRGELTRDEVRQRARRQRPQRVEFRTSRGKVTVEIAADDDHDEAPVVALREALARAESKRAGIHQDAA